MPCALTQSFPTDCRDGQGGVQSIYVANYEDVDVVSSGGTVVSITMTTGKQFYQYQPRKFTTAATETNTVNDANGVSYYAPSITFQLTRLDANKRTELAILSQGYVVVIVQENDGDYVLYGSDKGLNVTTGSAETGTKIDDFNGYKYTIANGGESFPHLFVPSGLIPALLTPAS